MWGKGKVNLYIIGNLKNVEFQGKRSITRTNNVFELC